MKGFNIFNKKKMQEEDKNIDKNESLEEELKTSESSDNQENNSWNDEEQKSAEELSQLKDKYIRLVAEFDNYRKRTAKEKNELISSASESVMLSILEVLDDAERAESQMDKATDIDALKEGVHLIFNKLRNTLKSKGLKAMETLHTDFDPELHEAITEMPAQSEDQVGKVLDEILKGYYLNDKIIRHAKVVVGK